MGTQLPFWIVTALGTGPLSMRLGRYHLSECLGGGPTGEVYRATVYGAAGVERDFAVKRFHPELLADPDAARKIKAAAGLYGALQHPRVARLQELGEASGHTFIATEFVDGVDLSQLIAQGPLPLGSAAQLIVQVGRAVGYAHGRGLSHLGLSPTNIICTLRGEAKVTDFGFLPARLPRSPAEDPAIASRLCYLAPEQLEGKETSPPTDVYQLGVIAYELMVGRKPYAQTGAAELCRAMLSNLPRDSGLAKPFEKLLKRAMARSPFERFPDTGAMADALEAAMRSSPVPGSTAEIGKAVSKRQAFLRAQSESQASASPRFPLPGAPAAATPRAAAAPASAQVAPSSPSMPPAQRQRVFEEVTPPPIPGLGTPTLQGMSPMKRPHGMGEPRFDTSLPLAGDTDVDRAGIGRAASASDMVTIPDHQLIEDVPPLSEEEPPALSENIELGSAGTEGGSRRQFIGGAHSPDDDEEAQTLIREDSSHVDSRKKTTRFEAIDDSETIVKEDASTGEKRESQAQREPTEIEFEHKEFHSLDDEVSELLEVPSGLLSVEVPHLPTPASGPLSGGARGMPREIPPVQVQRLMPPGRRQPVPKAEESPRYLFWALLLLGLAAGGFFGYGLLVKDADEKPSAQLASDAGSVFALVENADASSVPAKAGESDGGPSLATDGGADLADQDGDAGGSVVQLPSDQLEIDSNPRGAQIYLDGTLVGKTPTKLDPSEDSHRLALIMPGYDLYTGDIQGKGLLKFDLNEVGTPDGPFGIKVRCVPRNRDRYYIYLDKVPVGQLCPSERLGVSRGTHEIEIYDPITDSRRVFTVVAEDRTRSHRVRVD